MAVDAEQILGEATVPSSPLVRPPRKRGAAVLSVFAENKLALAGLVIIVLVVLFCFLGPVFYSTNQVSSNLAISGLAPSASHPLGTDNVGYDELGRLMAGGQSSIEIGFAAAAIASVLGVLWGAVSGYFGGIVDTVMMRIVDAFLALPVLFVLLLMAAIVKVNAFNLTLVVALFSWLVPARLIRGETLSLRTREYIQAVRGMGGGAGRSIFLHVIPNAIGTIVVNITFQVADAILVLATLGYLGFGIPPPAANWGSMLSQGVTYLYSGYWWLIYPVGGLIILTVMAFNLVGDALRDAFDVRLQRR
ncbi:MAG: Peptide/nickel transport system permease protein [Acidimicrobiaceae bacterium]|jgi:peptide/nickel transport system permease protein|nr:Peptide/nickel transport system permease protein [Acidimicrobiaceae bacterium]